LPRFFLRVARQPLLPDASSLSPVALSLPDTFIMHRICPAIRQRLAVTSRVRRWDFALPIQRSLCGHWRNHPFSPGVERPLFGRALPAPNAPGTSRHITSISLAVASCVFPFPMPAPLTSSSHRQHPSKWQRQSDSFRLSFHANPMVPNPALQRTTPVCHACCCPPPLPPATFRPRSMRASLPLSLSLRSLGV